MKRRNHIWLVAALLSLLLLGAGATRPYWFPEVNVGGGYDAGGVSIDALGNIWVAGKIYGDVESTIEGLSTTGAAGTAPVSQGDGTLAMEGVYRPGYFIGAADIPTSITVGATGNVHQAALPASVVFNTDFFTGATESEAGVAGIVPGGAAGALNRFLCVDGTWAVPFIGAVVGPGASTHAAVAIWDGTTGDKVKNSLVQITSSGGIVIPGTISVGSGGHVLTNAAGKIDGGKLQAGTVTSYELSATGVSAGYYNLPALTVDAAGRVLAITDGALEIRELSDGPAEYGLAYQVLVMNAAGDGWEWTGAVNPSVLPHLAGDTGSGGVAGIAPAPGAGDAAAGKFLSADGTWATPSGAGNVAGPGTSTNNAIALFDGAGGQTLQDSSITSPDGDSLTIPGTVTLGSGNHVIANSAGLLDGGKLQAGSVGLSALDIAGGTAATTADDADLIAIYDDSATANRVMTRANFLAGISGGDDMGAVDTEAELESALTDVTDVLTDNDVEYEFLIDSAGTSGQVWTSNGSGKGGWAAATGGGASAFTDLTDAPSAYTGAGGKYVRVNSTADGLEFAAVSGGSGGGGPDTLCVLLPHAYFPTATAYATRDTRNNTPVLDFDADTNESALWLDVMPVRYAGGGITVEIEFAATSATSGDVVWTAALERIGAESQDLDADGFAAAKTVTTTVSSTCGKTKMASIAFADGAEMDSVAAGNAFRVQITRDANNAADTATGDAELVAVHIKETP